MCLLQMHFCSSEEVECIREGTAVEGAEEQGWVIGYAAISNQLVGCG
jgi:hypothetical protein